MSCSCAAAMIPSVVLAAEHVTKDFSLEALKEGERVALREYKFGNMIQRRRTFRNALIQVALEHPLPGIMAEEPKLLPGEPAIQPLHVLIVDDSPHVCEFHRSLILNLRPSARIKMCER